MLTKLKNILSRNITPSVETDNVFFIHDETIGIILKLLNDNIDIVFDVGAHHGKYSKAMNAKCKDVQIYCFEPFSNSFSILKQELTKSNFHLYPLAISDINGDALFYLNKSDETNSLRPSVITNSQIDDLTLNEKIIKVPVRTIDSLCDQENISSIDVLKIDAQGNTLNILTGAIKLLKLKKIKVIQCEVEFLEIYQGQSLFHHTTLFLEKYQYSLYSLYNVHYDINKRISWADAIYYINV